MKNILLKITITVIIITIIASCSTRKDRFLNRSLHATTTKYNVLYNGKVAYKTQKKQLDDNYKDDFWKVLPIEPLKIIEEISLPAGPHSRVENQNTSSGGFAKAEEKAVKAVQKHSMNIGGKERNKQIDDAYLLLGKSRYYDQRFVPALETFAYIQEHYPNSKLYNTARIWEAKSLIRLGIEDDAIFKLDLLLKKDNLPASIRHDALTAMALAYTKQDSVQNVINLLDSTLLYKTKKHNQKARNLFILGQLYRQQHKIDSSNIAFDKLSKFKKAPYRFKIHSKLERAKNYDSKTDNTEEIIASLKKLAKNRDNRPYLDGIFYQLGKVAIANNKIDEALEYYKKSISTKLAKDNQKSLAYEEIGNILFDKASFLDAGSYYDSVLNIAVNKNTKRIRRLTRKRNSLNEVIRLENSTKKNDSILSLASLSKTAQEAFFKTYIEKLKKQDKEAEIIAENQKGSTGNANVVSKQNTKGGSKFYFYNAQTVGFGETEFQKIWGNRALEDNWRLSNKSASGFGDEEENEEESEAEIDQSKKYDLDYYLARIPSEKAELDSIANNRNKAYYNLGLIYKEQFKKYNLATNKLEKLIDFSPNKDLVLPTYYHLYKSFAHFDMVKSDYYKNKIKTDYPDSKYTKIIENPDEVVIENDVNSPENTYKKTYNLYLDEEYDTVLKKCQVSISQFANTPIVPKFELLKAYAIAKTTNKAEFITALEFVATNYPNAEEGIHALNVIASLKGEEIKEDTTKNTQKKETNRLNKPNNKKATKKKTIKKGNEKLPSKEEMLKLIKNNKQNMGPPGANKKSKNN